MPRPGVAVRSPRGRPGLNGAPLAEPPFQLLARDGFVPVLATTRIGITRAAARPWRFVEAGSPWASGPKALNRAS